MTAPVERQEKLPASKEVVEVAPGVLRMQLPIELPGLRHVNCYAIADANGITLVDPGIPGPQSWKALNQRMDQAGIAIERVHTILITHSHPDHYGNAMRIREASNAAIVTHRAFHTLHQPAHVCVLDDCNEPDHIHPETGQVIGNIMEQRGSTSRHRGVACGLRSTPTPSSARAAQKCWPKRAGRFHVPRHE